CQGPGIGGSRDELSDATASITSSRGEVVVTLPGAALLMPAFMPVATCWSSRFDVSRPLHSPTQSHALPVGSPPMIVTLSLPPFVTPNQISVFGHCSERSALVQAATPPPVTVCNWPAEFAPIMTSTLPSCGNIPS